MAIVPANFNPQAFFDKTAYYASQGRGLFTLNQRPKFFPLGGDPLVDIGWKLVSSETADGGLMAQSINMTGYNLATFEEFSYIGPTRKHPHTQIFGPMTVEFLLMGQTIEEAMAVNHMFLKWQEKIAGARWDNGTADRIARSDSTFFAIEYYDNYTSDAEVKIYSPQNPDKPIIWNHYQEIYPQALGALSTSWESPDAPMSLSVTFEYFHTSSKIS